MSDFERSLVDLLKTRPGGLGMQQAARLLGVTRHQYRNFRRLVLRLLREGRLEKQQERLLLGSTRRGRDSGADAERAAPRRRGPRPGAHVGAPPSSVETERAQGMAQLRRDFGLPDGFPAPALAEARRLARRDPTAERDRLDLREIFTLAIDPADARDHDDAVSLEPTNGGLRLGVHIADVAVYVEAGSLLDREAFARGNSTYFHLDTVPMLPPLLAGRLCSLHEERDRPAVSVLLDFDPAGRATRCAFAETLVRVDQSLSYEEAEDALETTTPLGDRLRAMLELTGRLRAGREAQGAVQFELPEIRPVDEGGVVESFAPAPLLRSHRIVEEFMLAANHEVGWLLRERGLPRLLRVHERPAAADVEALAVRMLRRGVDWRPGAAVGGADYQALARRLAERPDAERLLVRLLRSMMKARYSEKDLGHFGLGWRDYLHFTSPIRRYADLVTHRQLKVELQAAAGRRDDGLRLIERDAGPPAHSRPRRAGRGAGPVLPGPAAGPGPLRLAEVAAAVSERELNSLQAEREGLRLEMAIWARRHAGERHAATVLEVFPTGLLLRLDGCGAEGFLPVSWLGREYFAWQEEREELRGERTGTAWRSGRRLAVTVLGANLASRRIDFLLEEGPDPNETREES
ncbi:MAG: VacB/RNase II family 3'-5' exoribonuclease [Candidatus Krumholzibacteriota bacterium]|nr:VacB/RNase II family 3'-5' exoribonuclease [Candidatus Krumholzibacteriota bacterium]